MDESIQDVGCQATGPFEPPKLLTNTIAHSTYPDDGTITISALYSMLTRVLEQTTALFQAQESTNHVLDELRQLIPELQRNAGLRRMEVTVETVVDGKPVDLRRLPSPHGTDPLSVDGATRSRRECRSPTVSAQETIRTSTIVHASMEHGMEEELPVIPPLPYTITTHPSITEGIISTVPSESQHGSDLNLPLTNVGNGELLVDVPDLGHSLMGQVLGPSKLENEERTGERQPKGQDGQASNGDPKVAKVLEEVRKSNVEHMEKLEVLLNDWRAEDERRREEIMDAVRATANEQVPYNVQGYLDEFSKSLNAEVRLLLGEVEELHEERRHIQHEIGYLMTMQSTLDSGGELNDNRPLGSFPYAFAPPPPPEDLPVARPAWRTIPQRSTRRRRRREAPSPPSPSRGLTRSWATWRPDPGLAITPPSVEPTLLVPDRGSPELFGPRSPRSSYYDLRSEIEEPRMMNSESNSPWAAWQPNPGLAPTPPSVEPDLLVLDRGSPGLFGPRSPRDSYHE